MGCCSSAEEPIKIVYHPMNDVLPSAPETDQIYEILEFWFCTTYTEWDRTNHIKPLNVLIPSLEKRDDVTSEAVSPQEPSDIIGIVNPKDVDELQKKLQHSLNMPDE